jgi:hypothetical protein
MVWGPMPADHSNIGGTPGDFNTDDPTMDEKQQAEQEQIAQQQQMAEDQKRRKKMQPVEQHSPTKVRVPGLRTIILGGSGGIRVRT